MNTRRALITGGTGFVGKHLVLLLQRLGWQVAVLAAGRYNRFADVEQYESDIRDQDNVRFAVHEFKPHHIYHLAAISLVGASWRDPRLTYDVNVFGTLNVLEAAMSLPTAARVLNVSTAQVYAPSKSPLAEDAPLRPDNPYAASKLMAEFLRVQWRNSGGGVITVRAFNHAGPGQSSDFVLSFIAKQFAEIEAGLRQPKLVMGNTHVKRDFADVRDVVEAYACLLEKGQVNEIYNVCTGHASSVDEIIHEFESLTGLKVDVETDPGKQRIGENDFVCGALDKIEAATGWRPRIPLRTTLQDLLSYWRAAVRESNASIHAPNSAESAPVIQLQTK